MTEAFQNETAVLLMTYKTLSIDRSHVSLIFTLKSSGRSQVSRVTQLHTCHVSPSFIRVTCHPASYVSRVTQLHTCHVSPSFTCHVSPSFTCHVSPSFTCHVSPSFTCHVSRVTQIHTQTLRTILLAVYNKNLIDSDDFLGEARISLHDFKHFHEIDNWFPLADLVRHSKHDN